MEQRKILASLKKGCDLDAYVDVVDMYYDHKYFTTYSTLETNLDQCVSFHSNKICVVSLAERHEVVRQKKKVKSVICKVNEYTNRWDNVSRGRMKRGAQKLESKSILCNIECEDGSTYPVFSCVKAKLIEINESLLQNPQLLVDKPLGDGYIAILFPMLATLNEAREKMTSREEYLNCTAKHLESC